MVTRTEQNQGGSDSVVINEAESVTVQERIAPEQITMTESSPIVTTQRQAGTTARSFVSALPRFNLSFTIKVTNNLPR